MFVFRLRRCTLRACMESRCRFASLDPLPAQTIRSQQVVRRAVPLFLLFVALLQVVRPVGAQNHTGDTAIADLAPLSALQVLDFHRSRTLYNAHCEGGTAWHHHHFYPDRIRCVATNRAVKLDATTWRCVPMGHTAALTVVRRPRITCAVAAHDAARTNSFRQNVRDTDVPRAPPQVRSVESRQPHAKSPDESLAMVSSNLTITHPHDADGLLLDLVDVSSCQLWYTLDFRSLLLAVLAAVVAFTVFIMLALVTHLVSLVPSQYFDSEATAPLLPSTCPNYGLGGQADIISFRAVTNNTQKYPAALSSDLVQWLKTSAEARQLGVEATSNQPPLILACGDRSSNPYRRYDMPQDQSEAVESYPVQSSVHMRFHKVASCDRMSLKRGEYGWLIARNLSQGSLHFTSPSQTCVASPPPSPPPSPPASYACSIFSASSTHPRRAEQSIMDLLSDYF